MSVSDKNWVLITSHLPVRIQHTYSF